MRRSRVRKRVLGSALALVALLAAVTMVVRGAARPDSPVMRTVTVGASPNAIAVDERSNRVFVANAGDETVSVLDAASGRVLRTIALPGAPGAMAVDERAGRVFVLSQRTFRDLVSLLDARSGRLMRTVGVGQGADAVAFDDTTGRAFVTNGYDDDMSVLDAASGRVLRAAVPVGRNPNTGYNPQDVVVDAGLGHVFTANSSNDSVSMFDARTARLLRVTPVSTGPTLLALDQRTARVFVACFNRNYATGDVSVLDARSGRVMRTLHGLTAVMLAVNERTGRVFAIAPDGRVSVLDALSGAPVGQVALHVSARFAQGRSAIAVDAGPRGGPNGRIIVLVGPDPIRQGPDSPGAVLVLDGKTGRLLQTLSTGIAPVALASDRRAERDYVVNSNRNPWPGYTPPTPTGTASWGWLPGPIRHVVSALLPRPTATPTLPASGTVSIVNMAG